MTSDQPVTATVAEFLAMLDEGAVTAGTIFHLAPRELADGRRISIPLKLLHRPEGSLKGRPLVVFFHGAVDRSRRRFPIFDGVYALKALEDTDAVVLSVADPSLWLSPDLRIAWYAPSRFLDTPKVLRWLFREIGARLTPRRTIFVGGSTGGHAALLHSRAVPDSLCVAVNPIACISRYYPSIVRPYLRTCWGGGRGLEDLDESFTDDVGKSYAAGHSHDVILLQNATDHHFVSQAAHFAAQLKDAERFLFLSRFFPDAIGHAYPGVAIAGFVRAAVRAPTTGCREVARLALDGDDPVAAPSGSRVAGRAQDLAARLAAAVLDGGAPAGGERQVSMPAETVRGD